MINDENERAAYMAGNLALADLYHQLGQQAQALREAVAALGSLREQHIDALAELGGLRDELVLSNSHADDLQRELDRAAS